MGWEDPCTINIGKPIEMTLNHIVRGQTTVTTRTLYSPFMYKHIRFIKNAPPQLSSGAPKIWRDQVNNLEKEGRLINRYSAHPAVLFGGPFPDFYCPRFHQISRCPPGARGRRRVRSVFPEGCISRPNYFQTQVQ